MAEHSGLEEFATWAVQLRLSAVPPETTRHAARVIRDTIGVLLAGARQPENATLAAAAPDLGGEGPSTVVGQLRGVSAPVAALVNATAAVTLELDEGNQFATNHPAVHVLPAALAVAEEQGASGQDLLVAFLVGYEVAARAGRATRLRGPVHPFGTTMVLGAAAAAARLRGLGVHATTEAMRIAAGTAVASSQSAANSGASARNLCTGLTSQHGVLATSFAAAGFSGECGAASTVFGQILGEAFDGALLTADLETFLITRNYFKMHACSRWNHAPIEAVAELMAEESVDPGAVERAVVWTYDPATRLNGQHPPNGYASKHSIPYNVAVRIVHGTNDLTAYTDAMVGDPAVRALAERVEVREDPALTARAPDVRAAKVDLWLADGRVRSRLVEHARGGFDNPYHEDALLGKFRTLAGMALAGDDVNQLTTLLANLTELADLAEFSAILRGADVGASTPGR
jgi:2-methylcitrate dehydratase PrpD